MIAAAALIFAWGCALVVGYSANQGGTCAVAAARALVERRSFRLFLGFAVASGAAGLVCLPAAWALGATSGMAGHLAGSAPIGMSVLAGALLLGIGAIINDACLLGSLWRVGNGELRLFALPVGLALGFGLAERAPVMLAPHLGSNGLGHPSAAGVVIVAGSGIVLLAALLMLHVIDGAPPRRRRSLARPMALLGVCGALLYVVQPGWSYADAVHRGVSPLMAMMRGSWGGTIAAALTVAGAMLSAIRQRVFRPAWPSLTGVIRSITGGMLIAIGATMIPGGNDTLLLASVPAGSVSGAFAYTAMTVAVVVLTATIHVIGGGRLFQAGFKEAEPPTAGA